MSYGSSENQTRSFLMQKFEDAGMHPRSKLGQNFLIDLNLVRLLARAADIGPDDVVLEVGTGVGSLTGLLCQEAGHVITVELDQMLYEMAFDTLRQFDNLTMIQGDILKNKNRLNAEVLETIDRVMSERPGARLKLAANLPYSIATPLMSNLLLTDHPPASMTVTIQKELAERIVARPKTKDYGSLAIWMQSQCQTEIVRIMPPTVFWPRPKVESAIIQVVYDQQLRDRIPDLGFFHQFTRAMFFHRRKFLRSELLSAFKKRVTKEQVDDAMTRLELKPNARAEELSVETFIELAEAMRAVVGSIEL